MKKPPGLGVVGGTVFLTPSCQISRFEGHSILVRLSDHMVSTWFYVGRGFQSPPKGHMGRDGRYGAAAATSQS